MTCSLLTDTRARTHTKAKTEAALRAFGVPRFSPSSRSGPTYVETTLLYNSETWAMTENQEESLNAFQRRLLRIALNIRYPKIISNAKLYNITKEIPISEKIKRRRLALLGHILRLDVDTPAQKALQFYLMPHKRPVGRPVTTWVQIITKDLKNTTKHHNIKTPLTQTSLQKLIEIAKDNVRWKQEIVRCMKRDL